MSYSLKSRIAIAIKEKNLTDLLELKRICDLLHDGEEEVESEDVTYTPDDLPPDSIYEQLVSAIEKLNIMQVMECDTRPIKRGKQDYFMGSVPKKAQIEQMQNAILMPKYDGVSCGMTFVRDSTTRLFSLEQARTRGAVEAKAQGSRKYQDITPKIMTIVGPIIDSLNNPDNQSVKVGNHLLSDLVEIIIRGEIVLNDYNIPGVPASIVAGKINGKMGVWNEYKDNIIIKPFEFVRATAKAPFTITQLDAIEFFNAIAIECPYALAKNIRPTEKSLAFVRSLFDTHFNDDVKEPIDGVVYCQQEWLYPYDKSDNGKSNYGKYAWKPSNESTTVIKAIEETRTKEGKIEFSVIYEPIGMENKTFNHCAIVPTTINKFIERFGIGSTITIMLRDNTMPYVKECEIPLTGPFEPWHFPTHCSCCGAELEITEGSKDTVSIRCPNEMCNKTMIKLCADACKKLKITKCADATIETFFNKYKITQYDIYDLLIHAMSPAQVQFRSRLSSLNVNDFFTVAFTTLRSQKQLADVIDRYKMTKSKLHLVRQHKALVESIYNDETLSFYTREFARACLELIG